MSEKYARLAEYAGNVSLSPVHKKYVSTLLNGGDFTNSGKLFGDSVVDPRLLEMVIEYLTEKIENGEC